MNDEQDDYSQPDFYRFSQDSIWMAAQVAQWLSSNESAHDNLQLIDVGAGCGIIGLEILQIFPHFMELHLWEKNSKFLNHLEKNVKFMNPSRLSVKVEIVNKDFQEILQHLVWQESHFLIMVSNPPYFLEENSRPSSDPDRQSSRQWGLSDWRRWWIFLESVMKRPKTELFFCYPLPMPQWWVELGGKNVLAKLELHAQLAQLGLWRCQGFKG